MVPVLATKEPLDAKKWLTDRFGFSLRDGDMWLGTQAISIVRPGDLPAECLALKLDHVALSVDCADQISHELIERGAKYDNDFTPNGPREIREFWEDGVRYVFFEGPEGAPIEFCEIKGSSKIQGRFGHGHYAIRRQDFEKAVSELLGYGANLLARHRLVGKESTVNVSFLCLRQSVFEVFDEPCIKQDRSTGWVGLWR